MKPIHDTPTPELMNCDSLLTRIQELRKPMPFRTFQWLVFGLLFACYAISIIHTEPPTSILFLESLVLILSYPRRKDTRHEELAILADLARLVEQERDARLAMGQKATEAFLPVEMEPRMDTNGHE